jgi:hypothetical protein
LDAGGVGGEGFGTSVGGIGAGSGGVTGASSSPEEFELELPELLFICAKI